MIWLQINAWWAHIPVEELREMPHPIFYRSFFFSKKVLRCHNCQPATARQTRSDMIPNHATLEFVSSFKSRISASLETIQNQIQILAYLHSYNDIHQKLLSSFWLMQIVRQPISLIWLLPPFPPFGGGHFLSVIQHGNAVAHPSLKLWTPGSHMAFSAHGWPLTPNVHWMGYSRWHLAWPSGELNPQPLAKWPWVAAK